MKLQLLSLVLIVLPITSYGQQHWQIKFDAGYSAPVSKYGKVDVSKTISIVDGSSLAEYFDKKDHGAAETGSYYAVTLSDYSRIIRLSFRQVLVRAQIL
ncbi:MAG TPA: hypothetical protein VKZ75_04825 [Cyclobacteriaceae bacterium]|nr:hypothetical protein [Cyclobacteriaceae bacterium]